MMRFSWLTILLEDVAFIRRARCPAQADRFFVNQMEGLSLA